MVAAAMQSSLVHAWTPTKSSSAVDVVSDDLSSTDNAVVARRLTEQGATEATPGDLELELAAMQACYVQLKHLVPTVPLNVELSSLQLLQHVIDYIVDLELALHSSASASSSPWQQPQQQPSAASCRGQKHTRHGCDVQCSSSASLTDVRNASLCDDDRCCTTRQTSPPSHTHCDIAEPHCSQL